MEIKENTPILKPQLLKDSHIVKDFIRMGIQGQEIEELNRCHIYLKETFLSDLSTWDSKSISPTFWPWKPNLMKPQYKCPPQIKPHQKAWKNWQVPLQSIYNVSRQVALTYNQRMGL